MRIKGKQLEDTLRTADNPFEAIHASQFVGAMDGSLRFKCKNAETTAMSKGQAVYISGVSGDIPEVKLADADGAGTVPAIGLTESAANASAEVFVVSFGNLTGLDTASLNTTNPVESIVGRSVFIGTTPGQITIDKPAGSSAKLQNIGQIVREHGSEGIIKVGGAGRTAATPNLDEGKFFIGDTNNKSSESAYTLPVEDGAAGQVLTTDGAGAVTFSDVAGGETFTDVTADIAVADFEAVNYRIDPANTAGITINLPTVRYNETQALALDGESFTVNNMSAYDLTLRIADAFHYNGAYYAQSYIRHSGQYDENGIGTGEPISYIIRPFSSVRIHVNTLLTVNVKRVIYNVIASGGILGGYHHSSQTSSFTAQLNNVYMCKPSSGDITATLPNINNVGDGERIQFKNTHSSGVVYIDPLATQNIENSSSALALTSLQSATIVKSGTSWYKV